jgi:hypothetical protein
MDTTGIDVDWPKRAAVRAMVLRRPRLLVERDDKGEFDLLDFVTPRWDGAATSASPRAEPVAPATPKPSTPAATPRLEIGTLELEKASARFVDHTTAPAYVEEMTEVELKLTGVTTVPGQRVRFTTSGAMPGGATFKAEGQFLTGERPQTEMSVELKDVVIPRTNPYLEKYTSWSATRGSLSATATYTLDGTEISAKHDVVVQGLEVKPTGAQDQVEERLGLPMSFLVSLMKDARGEIKLSVPVAGNLASREFDFTDAVWSAVRSLTVRVLALPFSRLGSVFVREDSKVAAIAIAPVVFEAGTATPAPDMGSHLDRLAVLLRDKPELSIQLVAVNTVNDVDALKRAAVIARLRGSIGTVMGNSEEEVARTEWRWRWADKPAPDAHAAIIDALVEVEPTSNDALRDLRMQRVAAVRRELDRRGVAAARLEPGRRGATLVEAAGAGRVEIDLRQ